MSNEVDWHEENRLLKVAFPLAVHSPRATFEIQYGHVERPTHTNTSWEEGRFEVCAHRWADYSEPGYGAALLNDGKYGYDIRDDVLRLSLLRSPTWPDPEADRGGHRFTYQLLPHAGDLRPAGVVDAGYDLMPPGGAGRRADRVGHPGPPNRTPVVWLLLSVDVPNTVVERSSGPTTAVVRWSSGSTRPGEAHGPVTLTAPWPMSRVTRTDLLERELTPVPFRGDRRQLRTPPLPDPHPQARAGRGLGDPRRPPTGAGGRLDPVGPAGWQAVGGAPAPPPFLVAVQESLPEGVLAHQWHGRPPDGQVVGSQGQPPCRGADGWPGVPQAFGLGGHPEVQPGQHLVLAQVGHRPPDLLGSDGTVPSLTHRRS